MKWTRDHLIVFLMYLKFSRFSYDKHIRFNSLSKFECLIYECFFIRFCFKLILMIGLGTSVHMLRYRKTMAEL